MRVELVDFMGDDLSVVNAARVSFDKVSERIDGQLQEKDVRLIHYLADHLHWSPFAQTQITFRVTMPIYVARQLAKHQVGGTVNEISRRYVSDTPVLDVPKLWRKKADNVKQGSSDELVHMDIAMRRSIARRMDDVLDLYEDLLLMGVCPEQARSVLPICCETTWIWSGSLAFFARVCKLRLDAHAQKETRDVAVELAKILSKLYPHSFKALMGEDYAV